MRPYGAPYRFESARLSGRCWAPEDAVRLRAALDRNDRHLRPWIPWMREEPRPLEGTLSRLRSARAAFDRDIDYRYGLFMADDTAGDDARVVGEVALLGRVGPDAFEIGYWIDQELNGQGLATEAAAAVVRIAFEICAVDRLEIHHSAGNAPSGAVPRKLGFTQDATLRRRSLDSDGVVRDMTIWSLFADEYAASAARDYPLRALDALGTAFPLAATEAIRQEAGGTNEHAR